MVAALTSNVGISLISSLVGALLALLAQMIIEAVRSHPVRRFWRGYSGETLIMTTEYAIQSRDGAPVSEKSDGISFEGGQDQFIASHSTSGYFLSYGLAMALANLLAYLERDMKTAVKVVGDKGHREPSGGRNIIILGSPANNRYLPRLLAHLGPEFPSLKGFSWTVDDRGISLTLPSGDRLVPQIDDHETGTDFALVMSMAWGFGQARRLVTISGCNMWGTEAATRFLLDQDSIRSLPREIRSRPSGIAFVVKAWIASGRPDRVELCPLQNGSKFIDLKTAWPVTERLLPAERAEMG